MKMNFGELQVGEEFYSCGDKYVKTSEETAKRSDGLEQEFQLDEEVTV